MNQDLRKYRFGNTLKLEPSCFAIGTITDPTVWIQTVKNEVWQCMFFTGGSFQHWLNWFYFDLNDHNADYWQTQQQICSGY